MYYIYMLQLLNESVCVSVSDMILYWMSYCLLTPSHATTQPP